jgi:V/A-type H+-transporting ATPase subunit B
MQATYSDSIFGRIFNGSGEAIDNGPSLSLEPKVKINGPTVNPASSVLA